MVVREGGILMATRAKQHRPAGYVRGKIQTRNEARRRYDATRASSSARGYGKRWGRYRTAYLAQHPLCVMCERAGRLVTATQVDHIRAVYGPDDPGFWDEDNHQGLCRSCHSRKTATLDGGLGHGQRKRVS